MKSYRQLAFMVCLTLGLSSQGLLFADSSLPESKPGLDPVLWAKAQAITRKCLVADTHADTTMRLGDAKFDFGKRNPRGHIDLPKLKEGKVKLQAMAVFTSARTEGPEAVSHAVTAMEKVLETVERFPADLRLARTSSDVEKYWQQGKISLLLTIENGNPVLENRLELLRLYHRLGVRMASLCHMKTNFLCDSSNDDPRHQGLSPWGEKVIREMNRLGMMVDVSHLSDDSVRDILAITGAPLLASHSCCRSLVDIPRNLSDELIIAIAKRGGMIHINFAADYLSSEFETRSKEVRARLKPEIDQLREKFGQDREKLWGEIGKLLEQYPVARPPVEVLVDHIDHVVKVAGIDHAGLGSDFDGISAAPEGINGCQDIPLITYTLLKRGYREEQIRKILGGNFLRYFQAVEKAAAAARPAGTASAR